MSQQPYRILHTLPDLMMGGGQKCVLNNIIYLDSERFTSYVCYFLPYRDMESSFVQAGVTPLLLHHRGFWSCPGVFFKLVRFLRDQQIDLVHIQGPPLDKIYVQIAAFLCRIPVVRTLQGVKPELPSLLSLLKRPRPRRLLQATKRHCQWALDCVLDPLTVRHVIAVSDAVYQSWQSYLHARGVRDEQVTLNHNAIPTEQFTVPPSTEVLNALRDALNLHEADPILINVARLTPGKGQALLVEMMPFIIPRWPRAKLLLIGDGEQQTELERMIQEAHLESHIHLLGQRTDIPALLAISDVFVFSSFFEGFPLTVLEAMAAGKPVVATQLPPLRELQNEGTGMRLIDERDAQLLAQAVMELIEEREQARAVGRQGQSVVAERYSMTGSVKRLEDVYISVLDGGKT